MLGLFGYDSAAGVGSTRQLRLSCGSATAWAGSPPRPTWNCARVARLGLPLAAGGTRPARASCCTMRACSASPGSAWCSARRRPAPCRPRGAARGARAVAAAVQRITADLQGERVARAASLLQALGIGAERWPGRRSRSTSCARSGRPVAPAAGCGRRADAVGAGRAARAVLAAASIWRHAHACVCKAAAPTPPARGRFGWHADLTASPPGRRLGQLRFGRPEGALPTAAAASAGDLAAGRAVAGAALAPGRRRDDAAPLWPQPDAQPSPARWRRPRRASAAMSALELMRRADDAACGP